jgi:hypothetical protein
LINSLLVGGAALLLLVLNGGIDVGSSNHHGLIPVMHRILDPTYLPRDFGIDLRWHHHKAYAYLIAGLAWALGEVTALAALKAGQTLLLATGLWLLCRALGIGRQGFALVTLMLATGTAWTGLGLETNTFIGNPEAQPPTLAHALILIAVAALTRARVQAAALCLGLATLVHTQIGLVFSALAFPLFVALFAAPGARRPRVAMVAGGLWLIPALVAAVPIIAAVGEGALEGEGYLAYVAFRMPHHFELRSGRALAWFLAHVLIVTGAFMYFMRRKPGALRGPMILFFLTVALGLAAALHFADYKLLHWGAIARLQAIRLSPFVSVFGSLMLVLLLQKRAEEGHTSAVRRLNRAALLPAAWAAVAITIGMHWDRYAKRWDSGVQVAADVDPAWADMARWVREHGGRDTTYLTPPGLYGFAHLAERSPVVEFKINPDGARYLDEWLDRLTALSGGHLPAARGFSNQKLLNQGYFRLAPGQLAALGRRYGAAYAIVQAQYPPFGRTIYENAALKLIELPAPGAAPISELPRPSTGAGSRKPPAGPSGRSRPGSRCGTPPPDWSRGRWSPTWHSGIPRTPRRTCSRSFCWPDNCSILPARASGWKPWRASEPPADPCRAPFAFSRLRCSPNPRGRSSSAPPSGKGALAGVTGDGIGTGGTGAADRLHHGPSVARRWCAMNLGELAAREGRHPWAVPEPEPTEMYLHRS